jgi:hypothetical protein
VCIYRKLESCTIQYFGLSVFILRHRDSHFHCFNIDIISYSH